MRLASNERTFSTKSIADRSYIWKEAKDDINISLQQMVVPAHILIDSSGTVLKRFPGSARARENRDRMGNRIVEEILGEKQRLTAID